MKDSWLGRCLPTRRRWSDLDVAIADGTRCSPRRRKHPSCLADHLPERAHRPESFIRRLTSADSWRAALLSLLAAVAYLCLPTQAPADSYETTEQVSQDLAAVAAALEARKLETAARLLEAAKRKMDWENHHGLDYPQAVLNEIRALNAQLRDAEGTIDTYPSVSGIIVEAILTPYSGLLVVQGAGGTHDFRFDAGLIVDRDCDLEEGRRVRIHFEPGGLDDRQAAKITCLR